MYYQRRNKYGAKKTFFKDRRYDSKKEAGIAQELDLLLKAGQVKEVIPQYRIDLQAYGRHICNYFIDFKVINADDSVEYIEVKGFETEVWRLKWKLAEAQINALEPGARLVVIK